jgi:type 1 fimbriae regulatory protein FimB/type 1 fimbriae regulatory protein FimE
VKKKSEGERQYLRLDEINAMMKVARKVGRHGLRDSTISPHRFESFWQD